MLVKIWNWIELLLRYWFLISPELHHPTPWLHFHPSPPLPITLYLPFPPGQDPCSVCASWVYPDWVQGWAALLCIFFFFFLVKETSGILFLAQAFANLHAKRRQGAIYIYSPFDSETVLAGIFFFLSLLILKSKFWPYAHYSYSAPRTRPFGTGLDAFAIYINIYIYIFIYILIFNVARYQYSAIFIVVLWYYICHWLKYCIVISLKYTLELKYSSKFLFVLKIITVCLINLFLTFITSKSCFDIFLCIITFKMWCIIDLI